MVSEGRGRLFRRADGKFLIYLPMDLCQDSMFPFKLKKIGNTECALVKVSFKIGSNKEELLIERWPKESPDES